MIDAILKSDSRFKLDILSLLSASREQPLSIRKLSQHFECSHQKMQAFVTEIYQDLSVCFSEPILTTDEGVQIISEAFHLNIYKQYLIQQSVPYQMVLYALMEPDKDISDFCKENYLSRASVSRTTTDFIQYLKEFDIKLNLSQLQWKGPEAVIRFVFFNVLWLGSHGDDVNKYERFFREERKILHALGVVDSSHVDNNEVFLMLVISRIRNEQKHWLTEIPFKNLIFPKENIALLEYLASYISDEDQLVRQYDYLGYIIFYSPYYLCEKDERIGYVERYYHYLLSERDPLALLLSEFESFYREKLLEKDIDEASLRLLHVNIFTTFLNYSIRKGPVPQGADFFKDQVMENNAMYQKLSKRLTYNLKKLCRRKHFAWLGKCLPSLVDILTFTLLPYYEHRYEKNKLIIGLMSGSNFMVLQDVKNFLKQFSFLEVRLVAEDESDLDVLVSVFPKTITEVKKPTFSVESTTSTSYQLNLFTLLQKAYREKLARAE